ncbi:MAG: hypothetical protein OXI83_19245, partial [Gemmatimonadota bacterium]|nr:hypothetical protein [Gemmatimonadota bacterium]
MPPSHEPESRWVREFRSRVRPGPECPTSRPKKYQSSSRQWAPEVKPTLEACCWQKACRPGLFAGTIC